MKRADFGRKPRKKVLALVLAMAMSLSLAVTAGAAYKDGDKISAEYDVAVEVASQLGILEGFEDGTYRPQGTLTRAQLATMTYRIATGDVEDVYTANFAGGAAESFADTPATAWYAGYVGYAADAGYLKGMGDGTYAPDSALTGYQALAATLRAIGYNQPGQFTGADWTVQVAMIANEIGALDGIKGVDLNGAISREVAAQIIFNILFSDKVDYTPAFGYQNAWGEGSLATDVFDIDTGKDGKIVNVAPWGRIATQWFSGKDAVVSIAAKPVATFTTAVSECEMSLAVGEKDDWSAYRWLNGELAQGTVAIDPIKTKANVAGTDQGTLTEVYAYEYNNETVYEIVEIETWLGQIDKVTDATYDKKGHEKTPATVDLYVWAAKAPTLVKGVEYTGFAEDDYVLINYSDWQEDGKDIGYFLTKTAPAATAIQTKIDINKEVSTIGGTEYNWAAKYFMGFSGLLNTEYEVFEDFYGNVIGIKTPDAADPVYTIMNAYTHYTDGFKANYDAAQIVDLTDGALEEVVVDTVDGKAPVWNDDITKTTRKIFAFTSDADGYDFVRPQAVVVGESYSVVKGTPRIVADDVTYVTDANTVYAVEVETDVFEIYTGYANVPSISDDAKIEILEDPADDDQKVDLVYIDARSALFAGEEYFAYVMTSVAPVAGGALADETLYESVANVVIDGEVVDINVVPGFVDDMLAMKGLAVTLKTNDDGLVYAVEAVEGFNAYAVYDENSNEVIYVTNSGDDKSYVVTDETIIWIVNESDNWVEIGTADDVVPGYDVAIKVAANGTDADIIIIWDKTVED